MKKHISKILLCLAVVLFIVACAFMAPATSATGTNIFRINKKYNNTQNYTN